MAKAGRKRTPGNRNKNGKLKRDNYPAPRHDHGTERVQALIARYGVHYATALGRAYASGMLGTGSQADDRYQAGKRFARLQKQLFARGYRCPLDTSPRGGNVVEIESDHDQADQAWIYHAGDKLAAACLRAWIDQLVSEEYVDRDPPWLTRLHMGGTDPYDTAMLAHCIRALDLIAPARKDMGIRSVRTA